MRKPAAEAGGQGEFAPSNADAGCSDYRLCMAVEQLEQCWPAIPDWPLCDRFGPLFAGFEISLGILRDSLIDASSRRHINNGEKCEAVFACVNAQLHLLTELVAQESGTRRPAGATRAAAKSRFPLKGLTGPASSESAWGDVMAELPRIRHGARWREVLAGQYQALVDALGFELGLNGQAGFDYDQWVRPGRLRQLSIPENARRNLEQTTFIQVHRLGECLLQAMRAELDAVEQALYRVDYLAAESRVLMSARCAGLLDAVLGLLGELEQAEVARLQIGHGALDISLSPRWRDNLEFIRDHCWLLVQQLRNYGLDPFLVLLNPAEYVVEHRLLQAFDRLAATMRRVSANHFPRRRSLGDGRDAQQTAPLLPELAEASARLGLWMRLKHAREAGAAIGELERRHEVADKRKHEPPTAASKRSRMMRGVDRYFETLRAGELENWLDLFSDPPHLEDPRGARPALRRSELAHYFRNLRDLVPRIDACDYRIMNEGANSLQVQWTIAGESFFGGIAFNATREQSFYFDPNGLICWSVADWDPQALADQLVEQHREAMLDVAG